MSNDRAAILDPPRFGQETAEVDPHSNGHAVAAPPKPKRRRAKKQTGPIRLNLGGRGIPCPGFIDIDRQNGKEAYPLPYDDNSVDEIRASHILEHFGHKEAQLALNDWHRALKPGGRIRIAVPDLEKVCQAVLRGDMAPWLSWIYGGQTDKDDHHSTGFTREILTASLRNVGFVGLHDWKSEINDCASYPISLNIGAYKSPPIQHSQPKFIQAVMTAPRLNFTANRYTSIQALMPLGIEERVIEGVYYHQNMEKLLEDSLNSGHKYALTGDYDSIFTREHVERLIVLMETTPEADAIAPIQVKRDCSDLLANCEAKTLGDLEPELVPAKSAHFGLTIFRLDRLKEMPHPWFEGKPGPDGRWGEGRLDPDMAFWTKFRECGLRLFLAPHLAIGHLQLVVTWPTNDLTAYHQYITDWRRDMRPPEIVRV